MEYKYIRKRIEDIERLLSRRKWITNMLRDFELKYDMESREFYERWIKGDIPEPEDPDLHSDFLVWAGLYEELKRIDRELSKLLKR